MHVGRATRGSESGELVIAAYETHQRELFTFALHATRDHGIAKEHVQESFLRLFRETAAGRAPENVRAWLYRVCANLITSRARRAAVADRWRSFFASGGTEEAPEGGLLRREAQREVEEALRTLPADARVALLLAAHGFSGAEIARGLGRSEGATRTMMSRARLKLRERLQSVDAGR